MKTLKATIVEKLAKINLDVDATIAGSVTTAVAKAISGGGLTPKPKPPARKADDAVPYDRLNSAAKQIVDAGRALKIAPHHFPTRQEMFEQTGPGVPNEVDLCKAAMRASRGPKPK
jgi:hypothetical protein